MFREMDMRGNKWLTISGNWTIRGSMYVHSAEGTSTGPFRLFICDKILKDGAVEATVRVSPGGDNCGRLVFRYGPNGCYYAGVGGYRAQYAIVKYVRDGKGVVSFGLALSGHDTDVKHNEPYDIRVEFTGDKIVLKSSGVKVLETRDNWFNEGNIGFETFGPTTVEFSNYKVYEVPPISNLLQILESFPYTIKRDLAYNGRELNDEKDVQRVLYTILRSHYSDIVDEEVLGRFGLKHYQDDFGIPSLDTIIEVKVIKDTTDLKKLQEQLMVDSIGYFKTMTVYRHLVYFIYNKANKLVDSSLISALQSLDPVAGVVIVPGVKL
jgi:hypothetical protein